MSRYSPRARLTNTISTAAVANWFGNQFIALPGSFESIATQTVGASGASTVTFSDIPQNYQHLQLRIIARGPSTNYATMRLNNDSGSNYAGHFQYGNGSSVSNAAPYTSGTILYPSRAYSALTNYFGSGIATILDYSNANKNKTMHSLTGDIESPLIMQISGLWMNTSAVTRIDLITQAGNFSQHSTFALYGIKGV